MKDGAAILEFSIARASLSSCAPNGALPADPSVAPRACPYQRCLPFRETDQPLSTAGDGTLPSDVWPYQIMFWTCACFFVTQSGVVLVPPSAAQRTAESFSGSYVQV